MSLTVEQAKEITQAITFDVWNDESKSKRVALLEKYCSPKVKAYAPDGSVTTGVEETETACDKLHADGRSAWKFHPRGDLWVSGNLIMQYWFFGIGEEGWKGWDVIILDENHKVASFYGLLDVMHTHQW